jgi:signal transduction histidine kinase
MSSSGSTTINPASANPEVSPTSTGARGLRQSARAVGGAIDPSRHFRRLGFRFQLVTMLLVVLGTTLVIYSVVLYRNFLKIHEAEFDTALYNYSVDVAKSLNVNFFGEVFLSDDIKKADDKVFPFALERTLIELRTVRGNLVAKSRELGELEIPLTDLERDEVAKNRVSFDTREMSIRGGKAALYRIANVFIDRPGANDFILQVASPMILLERERRGLFAFFFLSIPATLGIAGVPAFALSGRATKPINDIIRKARAITARRIDQRLPVPRVRDEIYELATTLNGLLDRLQTSFVSQEAFVADASHQLKTPLAILRGEIDIAKKKENRSPAEVEEFLESASQEVGYLSRMVEQLLILARLESERSGAKIDFAETRIDELMIEVISRMEKHSARLKKEIKLTSRFAGGDEADYTVSGDFDLIRTLMESLIDNAMKYTRDRSTVQVEVRDAVDHVEFRVTDEGEGFRPEEKERLFGRFWRSPKVEHSAVKGSGLGLSIVKKIADVHHAHVDVESAPGVGSTFVVSFPKAHADDVPKSKG